MPKPKPMKFAPRNRPELEFKTQAEAEARWVNCEPCRGVGCKACKWIGLVPDFKARALYGKEQSAGGSLGGA